MKQYTQHIAACQECPWVRIREFTQHPYIVTTWLCEHPDGPAGRLADRERIHPDCPLEDADERKEQTDGKTA